MSDHVLMLLSPVVLTSDNRNGKPIFSGLIDVTILKRTGRDEQNRIGVIMIKEPRLERQL